MPRERLLADAAISVEQDRQVRREPDNAFTPIIRATIDEVLDALEHRTLPVPARYLRRPAAARFLGLDPATLQDWATKGVGPRYRKLGNRVIYEVRALVEFVEQHPQAGGASPYKAASDARSRA